MNHTTKEIIENQIKYKNNILYYFIEDFKGVKEELSTIDCEDEFILKQKEKLESKFRNLKVRDQIEKMFFMHPRRNKKQYVWWDSEKEEALILKYDSQ